MFGVECEPGATIWQQLVGDGDLPSAGSDLVDGRHVELLAEWSIQRTRLDEQFGRPPSVKPMLLIGHEAIPGLNEATKQNAQQLAGRFLS